MSLSKPAWSYCSSLQETPFLYQAIPERIAYFANLHPKKNAFIDVDENGNRVGTITFGELNEKSVCFAKGLLELGIEKGDVVAIGLPNCVEWLVCTFGTLLVGGIPLYLNYVTNNGSELIDVIKSSERCRLFITEAGNNEQHIRICEYIFGKISSKGILECAILPSIKRIVFRSTMSSLNDQMLIKDILDAGRLSTKSALPTIYPEDIAAYYLTTGSTGLSKIVPRTHMHVLQEGYLFVKALDLSTDDVEFSFHEMSWEGTFPYGLIKDGITRVSCALDIINKSTDLPSLIIKVIQKERCTLAMFLPKLILSILNGKYHVHDDWRLKTVWTTGVPVPFRCAHIVPDFAQVFVNAYGTTEIGLISYSSIKTPSDFKDFQVGRPAESKEIKIINNAGDVVPVEVTGEILVRQNVAFSGYLNSSSNSDIKTTQSGWFKTEDFGYMEKTGNVVITSRKSEVIKVSDNVVDEFVSPYFIEEGIRSIDGVEEVCVVSYTDERKFTEICACIERSPGSKLTENDVESVLKDQLLGNVFSVIVPTHFVFFNKMPRNSRGKIQKLDVVKEAKRRIEGSD